MAGTTKKATRDQLFSADKRSSTAETTAELNKVVTDLDGLNALVTQLRTAHLYAPLGNPGFQIRTNFDVQNANAISYTNGGTIKTLSATSAFDTGTTKTITASKWGAAILSVDSSGTGTVTFASGAGYDSEALAIAGLASPGATHTVLGYVTILAAGSTWTAGTSALQGGTGGTPATTTNYYNSVNPNSLYFGSAYTVTAAQVAGLDGTVIT